MKKLRHCHLYSSKTANITLVRLHLQR